MDKKAGFFIKRGVFFLILFVLYYFVVFFTISVSAGGEITDEGKYYLKGDNNPSRDSEPFNFSVVNGKVVGILWSWLGLSKGGL